MKVKPRILVVSQVFPFPGSAGQQQRVYYTLKALREQFHITFLSAVAASQMASTREKLLAHCDAVILLPSRYAKHQVSRWLYGVSGRVFALSHGLKFSNFLIGKLELSPHRVMKAIQGQHFDLAIFEYWHAVDSAAALRERGIPIVLDLHNLLWQSYSRQLDAKPWLPGWWKRWAVRRYREREEQAWEVFDALIAINQAEFEYVKQRVGEGTRVFYTPMGLDLELWPYCWEPTDPPRVAYYGGLGSPHNQQDALTCYREIMPRIWERMPEAELWIVGSNPPESIRIIPEEDHRVHVTGFVEKVQEVLKTMSLVLCPWTGTYGFRSRVVEVMALGVPVVASTEAVDGMQFEQMKGIWLGKDRFQLSDLALKLLDKPDFSAEQSMLAHLQVKKLFRFDGTYLHLVQELRNLVEMNH